MTNITETKHTDRSFDAQLKNITTQIIKMGDLVVEILAVARKSHDNPTEDLVKETRKLDKKLNAIDFEVQQTATTIIALRQPMGVDLRFVVAALKISASMERMGDLAKSSCKKVTRFNKNVSTDILNDLKEMNALATNMVNGTISAFRDLDAEKASDILDQDDEIDDVYHQLLQDVQAHARKHPKMIPSFADIIFAAKNMERIGDHCTKLADLVHYIAKGDHVGKMGAQQKKLEDSA